MGKLGAEETTIIIDLVDDNVPFKEMNKLSKYKDLSIEITRMCGMRTVTNTIIVGVLKIITKTYR